MVPWINIVLYKKLILRKDFLKINIHSWAHPVEQSTADILWQNSFLYRRPALILSKNQPFPHPVPTEIIPCEQFLYFPFFSVQARKIYSRINLARKQLTSGIGDHQEEKTLGLEVERAGNKLGTDWGCLLTGHKRLLARNRADMGLRICHIEFGSLHPKA